MRDRRIGIRPGGTGVPAGVAAGRILTRAGFKVGTGGHGGVMESVSGEYRRDTLLGRMVRLIDPGGAFIIPSGKAGTLAELSVLLPPDRAHLILARPMVLWGGIRRDLPGSPANAGFLEETSATRMFLADTPESAGEALRQKTTGKP